jgi:hypothetical protein
VRLEVLAILAKDINEDAATEDVEHGEVRFAPMPDGV